MRTALVRMYISLNSLGLTCTPQASRRRLHWGTMREGENQ